MLLAKRKAASSAVGHFAFGPQEDESIIKHRLLTRTTTTRGEPPLKNSKRNSHLSSSRSTKTHPPSPTANASPAPFIQELTTFELPLLKSLAVIDANLREKDDFTHLKSGINNQILLERNEIDVLKVQLQQAKIERQHKEECESIRSLIAKRPPRPQMQKAITKLENYIAQLEAQNTAASRTSDLRKKQFALLLHVVDELQNTFEEEQKSLAEEMRMAAEEHEGGNDDACGPSVAMVVD